MDPERDFHIKQRKSSKHLNSHLLLGKLTYREARDSHLCLSRASHPRFRVKDAGGTLGSAFGWHGRSG